MSAARRRAVVWLGAAGWLALAAAPRLRTAGPLNHDVAWYLHVGERLLAGARLYRDVLDINPPLISELTTGIVWIAHRLGVDAPTAFHVAVLSLAAVSTALVVALQQRVGPRPPAAELVLWIGSLVYLTAVAPGPDFGQREHLLALLWLPLVFATGARWAGRPMPALPGAALGLLAAVGVALKPHFVLAPAALAVVACARRQRLRTPENLGLLAALVTYGVYLAWRWSTDDAMRTLAGQAAATYGGLDMPAAQRGAQPQLAECLVLGSLALLAPARAALAATAAALGASWAALLAAGWLQHKGWSYHWLAATSIGKTWLAWAALTTWLDATARRRGGGRAAALTGVAVLLAALYGTALTEVDAGGNRRWTGPGAVERAHARALESLGNPRSIAALDTSLAPHFPVVTRLGATWALSLPCLWPVPAMAGESRSTDRPGEQWLRDAVWRDLSRSAPAVVAVAKPPLQFVADRRFDLLRWLLREPRFAAVWSAYQPGLETERFADYVRKR